MAETKKTTGANPALDPESAANGRESAGAKAGQIQAAEALAVEKTQPAELIAGTAVSISFDDADGLEAIGRGAGTGEEYVVIDKDIIREFYFPRTRVPSHELLYHAGQLVPRSLLLSRAAAVRASQADKTKLENYIDATTLAGGTGANSRTDSSVSDAP